MRIGFIAEPYEESHASGMGYVILEMMRTLPIAGNGHEFIFYSSRPISRELVRAPFTQKIIPKGFVKQWLWFFMLREDIDVLVFMTPLLPLLLPRRVRAIAMCQELASQKIAPGGTRDRVRALVRDRILLPLSFARAESIIAASHATKQDILTHYHIAEQKIKVVYDGFQDMSAYREKVSGPGQRAIPFFFFAGKVKYRKNVHNIVSAFIAFKERTNLPCQLVLAGDYGGDYYKKIADEIVAHNCGNDIHFIGYTTGADLYSYYKYAVALLFVSLNEGFGMPIVESMSIGTPVITSNISSMAEVGGDAALLVDPHSVDEISRAMERIHTDNNLRQDLIKRGFERAGLFSWKKAAEEFMQIINEQ